MAPRKVYRILFLVFAAMAFVVCATMSDADERSQFHVQRGWDTPYTTPFGERPRLTDFGNPYIAVFGDSVDEVADHETWQENLAGMLQADVFHFGSAGYGADQALLKFREKYPLVRTPVVILELSAQSIDRIVNVYPPFYDVDTPYRFTKPRFELKNGALTLRENPIASEEEADKLKKARFMRQIGKYDHWYNTDKKSRPRSDLWEDQQSRELMFRIVDTFVAEATAAGAKPIIMYVPHPKEIIAKAEKEMDSSAILWLREYCQQQQYHFFNPMDAFIAHLRRGERPLVEFYHDHLTALGNRIIAYDLSLFLTGMQDIKTLPQEDIAFRQAMDKKYWPTEVLARQYELTFITLWDTLRMSADKWGSLKDFSFGMIALPTARSERRLELGVVAAEYSGSPRAYTREEFAANLERLQQEGYRLDQVEFHHEEFTYDTLDAAASVYSFVLNASHVPTEKKFSLRGEMRVLYSAQMDQAGHFIPQSIEVSKLISFERESDGSSFRSLFNIETSMQGAGNNPVVVYDLNHDGFSELIAPALNLIVRNHGNGSFDDEDLFVEPLTEVSSAFVGEFTGDNEPDLVVTFIVGLPLLFKGYAGNFDPLAVAINIDRQITDFPGSINAIAAGDIDNDGDLDLFLGQYKRTQVDGALPPSPYYDANDGETAYLLQNDGQGNFTDITLEAGLGPKRFRRTHSASFVDLDKDSDLDLVVANDFSGVDVFSNDGQGNFSDVTHSAVDQRAGFAKSLTFTDLDQDGYLDIFVTGTNSPSARRIQKLGVAVEGSEKLQEMMLPMAYGNRLFLGSAQPLVFRSAPNNDQLARSGWAWGSASFDVDNDGDEEIYVANGNRSHKSARDYDSFFWRHDIFMGDRPVDKSAFNDHYGPGGSWHGFEHNALFLNSGGSFIDIGYLLDVSFEFDARTVISDDINMDGRMDLIISDINGSIFVLLNAVKTGHNWIGVAVEEAAHRFAAGARVSVGTPEGKREWQIASGTSLISQNPHKKVFGLGEKAQVDYIEIIWPDGKSKRLDNPLVNSYYRILPPL